MNKVNQILLFGVGSAAAVGLTAAVMFSNIGLGINVPIILSVAIILMVVGMKKYRPTFLTPDMLAMCGAVIFFAGMFAFIDSPTLLAYNAFAIVGLIGLMCLPALKRSLRGAGITSYLMSMINGWFWATFGPLFLLFGDFQWKDLGQVKLSKKLLPFGKGLLIATPVLFVVISFLAAADSSFESLITRPFEGDFGPELILRTFIFCTIGYLALGLFRGIFFGMDVGDQMEKVLKEDRTWINEDIARGKKRAEDSMEALSTGVTEVAIVLGLMVVVFATFVWLQLPYLFGGMDLVQNTEDFKLADYARRGVTELILVSAFVVSVLLFLHWTISKKSPAAEKLFRVLSVVQIGLLFVVLASAMLRVQLLTGPLGYGMTQTRFYGMISVIWVLLILVWFGMTVLRNKRHHFAYGTMWTTLFVLGLINLINPEAFITQRNIDLMQQGRDFDARYHVQYLSADAVPTLVENLDKMSSEDQKIIRETLGLNNAKRDDYSTKDIRTWNFSRSRAKKLVEGVSNIR